MNNERKLLETSRDLYYRMARRNRLMSYIAYSSAVGMSAMTGFGIYIAESDAAGGIFFAGFSGLAAMTGADLARRSWRLSKRNDQIADDLNRLLEQDDQDEDDPAN